MAFHQSHIQDPMTEFQPTPIYQSSKDSRELGIIENGQQLFQLHCQLRANFNLSQLYFCNVLNDLHLLDQLFSLVIKLQIIDVSFIATLHFKMSSRVS